MTQRVLLSANNVSGSNCLRSVHRSGSNESAIEHIRKEENEDRRTRRFIQPLGAALFSSLYDNYNLNPSFDARLRS